MRELTDVEFEFFSWLIHVEEMAQSIYKIKPRVAVAEVCINYDWW